MKKFILAALAAIGVSASADVSYQQQYQYNPNLAPANYDTTLMPGNLRQGLAFGYYGYISVPKGPVAGSNNGFYQVTNNGDCTLTITPVGMLAYVKPFVVSGVDYIGSNLIITKALNGYSYWETEAYNWPVDNTVPPGFAQLNSAPYTEAQSKAMITALCPNR